MSAREQVEIELPTFSKNIDTTKKIMQASVVGRSAPACRTTFVDVSAKIRNMWKS